MLNFSEHEIFFITSGPGPGKIDTAKTYGRSDCIVLYFF